MPFSNLLRCIIIDDEQQSIDGLSAMLQHRFADVCTVVAASTNPLDGPTLLHNYSPDLLFIDVEMPRLSGLDVLRMLPDRKCEVVFTTAYTQYAVDAIKLQAADYLVKPYSIEELGDALKRTREKIMVNSLLRKAVASESPLRFALTAQNGVHLIVAVPEIVWVEATGNYSLFYFTHRPKLLVTKTLKEYDEQLSSHGFFRAHSSSLVNLAHVKSYHAQAGDDYLLMTSDCKVPLSRRKKAEFFERVQKL